MGQSIGQSLMNGPLCCVQDSSFASDAAHASLNKPTLQNVTAQSRNLQDPNWEVRAEAAEFFGSLGSENAPLVVPMLQSLLLTDTDWHVRQKAADALQDLGEEAVAMAAPALHTATKDDKYFTVRLAAVMALRKFGHKADTYRPFESEDQFHFEKDPHAEAARAFGAEDPHAVPKLDEAWMNQVEVKEPSEDTRLSDSLDISDISQTSPAKEHTIVLKRGATGKWGIDVDFVVNDGTCLRVSKVRDGAVADWNKEEPTRQIEVGDLLIELNGVSGNSKELIKVLSKAQQMEMVVQKGI
mmetsp:Transcript_28442/g.45665  ORF Transcript_28442/g.45665 Transcript_28442/m.45665 type:complete len:298 (+) Transcript_28442:126-1019(+)